jgi:hypothetical protein
MFFDIEGPASRTSLEQPGPQSAFRLQVACVCFLRFDIFVLFTTETKRKTSRLTARVRLDADAEPLINNYVAY